MKKNINKTICALGTVNSIFVENCENDTAIDLAMQRVQDIDDRFSAFKPQSEISKINNAAGKNFVEVKKDTMQILKDSVFFSQISQGAFDITIRPLVTLWGIGKKQEFIPNEDEIIQTKKLVCYKDIIFDEKKKSVKLKHENQAIDLGSIAKGYAADEVKRILLENSVTDAIINMGGTVIVIGSPRNVGIQHPSKSTGTPMGSLRIANKAIVTSGSYEKFFTKNGVRYHHILDPRTGMPSDTDLCSVTVIGQSAMVMDAITTAIFILGIEKGNQLLLNYNVQAIYVTNTFDVYMSPGLQDEFSLFQ